MMLVNRIDIKAEHVEIRVHRQRLHEPLQVERLLAPPAPTSRAGDTLKLKVKARLPRVSREMKLVVHHADDRTVADPRLLRINARAHDFLKRTLAQKN
jgi:site-specific DNA recombinase